MKRFAFILGCCLVACGTGDGAGASGSETGPCEPDTFRNCLCEGGESGTATCPSDGSEWGECSCAGLGTGGGGPSACGDQVCEGAETCVECPTDCGICPTCDLAPTCSGAFSIPTSPVALASFDNGGEAIYVSGVGTGVPPSQTTCSDPQLKIRIARVKVHSKGVTGGLDMFCMAEANDGQSSELILTSAYKDLKNDNTVIPLSPGEGTFWGQDVGKVKLSPFNITITYKCFRIVDNAALEAALDAIAGVAGTGAQVPGNPYGWAFGAAGAASAAASAAVAASDGNKLRLQVQQTIDAGALLELTNGRTWTVRQSGDSGDLFAPKWDWEIGIEAWGCANPRPPISE